LSLSVGNEDVLLEGWREEKKDKRMNKKRGRVITFCECPMVDVIF
jgi:hypothetical protein